MDLSALHRRIPAGGLLPATCFVALVHFGQPVLEPLALALILSLVIAPLVNRFRHLGLPRGAATIASVALVGSCIVAVALVLAFQLAAVAGDLPQYRQVMLDKMEQVRERTVRPLAKWRAELGLESATAPAASAALAAPPEQASEPTDQAVPRMLRFIARALAECGVVLILLVFMLLDPDALRDRLLRLAGRAELGSTLQALADAATGVSRFFRAQLVVNLCFGAVVAAALWFIGVPHATLFGALVGVLRVLPYVGMAAACIATAVFAAAVDPGWWLAVQAVGLLVVAEFVVVHVIEPNVYGHTSGLAPLGIIVSALFWSSVWGPVGLLLATPLTLCLVVAGRHVRALEPVTIFFGDSPGITQGQRLYHRALAGELRDIEDEARTHLARRGFASYCDHTLLPATALAAADHRAGRLQEPQLAALRKTLVCLVESLTAGRAGRPPGRPAAATLVEANVGTHLRRMREARMGRWQGPLEVPPGSIALCASLPLERDEFEAELLVRALSDAGIDARSVTLPHQPDREEEASGLTQRVATVFVACPEQISLARWRGACAELRTHLPRAVLATVRLPLDTAAPEEAALEGAVDLVLRSFAEAIAFVQARGRAPRAPRSAPALPMQPA